MTAAPRSAASISVGDRLPDLSVPLTASLIVASAIATRDYQEVHHDAALARARGSEDIFMNILTSQGFVSRYVTDWTGPAAALKRIAIKLGATNYPGDTMVLTGEVSAKREWPDGYDLDISVRATNERGEHLSGTVTVSLQTGQAQP